MKNLKTLFFVSTCINLLLLLLIWQGSVEIESIQEWINPSVVATLIGGVGGALAGTWISGNNANKQWRNQIENQKKENEQNYNMLVKELLSVITSKRSRELIENYVEYPNFVETESLLGEKKYGYLENDALEINKLFEKVESDIWLTFEEMELVFEQSDELARDGKVDWKTYRNINTLRFYKYYIKEYKEKISFIEAISETKEELVEHADVLGNTREYERVKEVLNTYDDLVVLRDLFIGYFKNIIRIYDSINKKL